MDDARKVLLHSSKNFLNQEFRLESLSPNLDFVSLWNSRLEFLFESNQEKDLFCFLEPKETFLDILNYFFSCLNFFFRNRSLRDASSAKNSASETSQLRWASSTKGLRVSFLFTSQQNDIIQLTLIKSINHLGHGFETRHRKDFFLRI